MLIGLPVCTDAHLEEFERVWKRCHHVVGVKPVVLLSTLVDDEKGASELCTTLKLPNYDKTLSCFIVNHRHLNDDSEESLQHYKDLIVRKNSQHIIAMVKQLLYYQGKIDEIEVIEKWNIPKFPLNGGDLKKLGVIAGPELGRLMNELKEEWIQSRFVLTKEFLTEEVKRLQGE